MHLTETTPLFTLHSAFNSASMSMGDGAADAPISVGQMSRSSAVRKRNTKTRKERRAVADMAAELVALDTMPVSELGARYEEVFGEPTRSHNKEYLKKQIAWRIQEQAEGGLSKRARALAAEIGEGGKARWRRKNGGTAEPLPGCTPRNERDSRLPPPGTTITREYKGTVYEVLVLQDGFEYQGQRHANLSRIAKLIIGTNWNGFLFWRLQTRARQAGADA